MCRAGGRVTACACPSPAPARNGCRGEAFADRPGPLRQWSLGRAVEMTNLTAPREVDPSGCLLQRKAAKQVGRPRLACALRRSPEIHSTRRSKEQDPGIRSQSNLTSSHRVSALPGERRGRAETDAGRQWCWPCLRNAAYRRRAHGPVPVPSLGSCSSPVPTRQMLRRADALWASSAQPALPVSSASTHSPGTALSAVSLLPRRCPGLGPFLPRAASLLLFSPLHYRGRADTNTCQRRQGNLVLPRAGR